jgi:hypothetical protein
MHLIQFPVVDHVTYTVVMKSRSNRTIWTLYMKRRVVFFMGRVVLLSRFRIQFRLELRHHEDTSSTLFDIQCQGDVKTQRSNQ